MIIRYFSWLKTITKIDEEIVNNSSIKDVNSLKKYLLNKYPKMKKYLNNNDFVRVSINLSYTYKNNKIKKNDEIGLFPPVSGG